MSEARSEERGGGVESHPDNPVELLPLLIVSLGSLDVLSGRPLLRVLRQHAYVPVLEEADVMGQELRVLKRVEHRLVELW